MSTSILIYSKQMLREARGDLEDDLDAFLVGSGEVTGGGLGESGWNIDVVLEDTVDDEHWAYRLAEFLREWGVPGDTFFEVVPDQGKPREVRIFANGS